MEQVTPTVYIGSMSDMNPQRESERDPDEFEHVITLGENTIDHTTEQYNVINNTANMEEFIDAVDAVRDRLNDDEMTFVHCTVGVSRAAATTATALAAERGISFDEGLDIVSETKDNAKPHPDIQQLAEEYLDTHTDVDVQTDDTDSGDDAETTAGEDLIASNGDDGADAPDPTADVPEDGEDATDGDGAPEGDEDEDGLLEQIRDTLDI